MVYDVSSRESFNNLANWLTDARTLASPAIIIILVGNKKDLEEEREVTFLEASRLDAFRQSCHQRIITSKFRETVVTPETGLQQLLLTKALLITFIETRNF